MKMSNPDIKHALRKDEIVFFIGSGFSNPVGYPNWSELVIQILDRLLEYKTSPMYLNLKKLLLDGKILPINALDFIKTDKKKIHSFLEEVFSYKNSMEVHLTRHKKIFEISKKVITTNYDHLLEIASEKGASEKRIKKVHFNNTKLIGSLKDEYILKLHGDIHDKCLIFREDYEEIYDGKSAVIEALKGIMYFNHLIFIGFSLRDPYVEEVFNEMNNIFEGFQRTHYIFTTENEDFSKYNIDTIKLDSYDDLDQYLDELINLKKEVNLLQSEIEIAAEIVELDNIQADFSDELVEKEQISDEAKSLLALYDSINLPKDTNDQKNYIGEFSNLYNEERGRVLDKLNIEHEFTYKKLKIISDSNSEPSKEEIKSFFKGFSASWECIKKDIPVRRSCYFNDARNSIFEYATKNKTENGLKAYVITGPAGVGKNTLSKQIAFDMCKNGFLVGWVEEGTNLNNSEFIEDIRKLQSYGERIQLFISIEAINNDFSDKSLIDNIKQMIHKIGGKSKTTLFFTIESNLYQVMKTEFQNVLKMKPDTITVPLNMDDKEIQSLVTKLIEWNSLGKLIGKKPKEILEIFQKKANKILLVALIEAIYGVDNNENFQMIMKKEYDALPETFKSAYAIVAISHAFNLPIPLELLIKAFKNIPGNELGLSVENLVTHFKEVLLIKKRSYVETRHPIVAKTLCDALFGDNETHTDVYAAIILESLIKSIDPKSSIEVEYTRKMSRAKMLSLIYDYDTIQTFYQDLSTDVFQNLNGVLKAELLNSIARILQGRKYYYEAIDCTVSSLKLWNDKANIAEIIQGYTQILLKNNNKAIEIGQRLVNTGLHHTWRILHGIQILCRAGAFEQATKYSTVYESYIHEHPNFNNLKEEIETASIIYESDGTNINPWTHAEWVNKRLKLGQIDTDDAIRRLYQINVQNPFIHIAIADLCHLLIKEDQYLDVVKLCDDIIERVDREKGQFENVDASKTKSMAYCTKAWALHLKYGISKIRDIKESFEKSYHYSDTNIWYYNWYALFLHNVDKDSGEAEKLLRKAINLNKNNAVFYRNLAKIIIENNITLFSNKRNNEVLELCDLGLRYCQSNSVWNWLELNRNLHAMQYYCESLKCMNIKNGTPLEEATAALNFYEFDFV